MSVALDQGNGPAMAGAIFAMTVMILCVDQVLWRPLVAWVERFRLDDTAGGPRATSWVLEFLLRARLPRRMRVLQRSAYRTARRATAPLYRPLRAAAQPVIRGAPRIPGSASIVRRGGTALAVALVSVGAALGAWRLWLLLRQVTGGEWVTLAASGGLTFVRVLGAVALSTAWALPAGVILGRSPRLARITQPIIQVVASFPAPMLFPIVILLLAHAGVGLGLGAVVLMVLSGQWYILFNVISAVAAIPEQLKEASRVFQLSPRARWRVLYLPATFPALVTGWVTAAGGAWNGSIVAEYIDAGGTLRTTRGLGSLISDATARANFPLLAGGIALMSVIVVGWNRLVWRPLMRWAHTRFGLEQ
jgi:NitT/TauT family transport system permease protein